MPYQPHPQWTPQDDSPSFSLLKPGDILCHSNANAKMVLQMQHQALVC